MAERTCPLRRGPVLLAAVVLLAVAVALATQAGVVGLPFALLVAALAVWFAVTVLRLPYFARITPETVDLLGRRTVALADVELAHIEGRRLILDLKPGEDGTGEAVSAPLRLSRVHGSALLALLEEHGVKTLPRREALRRRGR